MVRSGAFPAEHRRLLWRLCLRDISNRHRAHSRGAHCSFWPEPLREPAAISRASFPPSRASPTRRSSLPISWSSCEVEPKIRPSPTPSPRRGPFAMASASKRSLSLIPGSPRRVLDRLGPSPGTRRDVSRSSAKTGRARPPRQTDHSLVRPHEGRILLDGVDLREYNMEDLQRQIGVIFQDFMRYEMTARENIAVGRIELAHNGDSYRGRAKKPRRPGHRQAAPALRADARPAF